jgi:hypothetical protein
LLLVQNLQSSPGNFWTRYPPGLLILGGLPILAIALLLLIFSFPDSVPTDQDGRPTTISIVAFAIILSIPVAFMIRGIVPLFSKTAREMIGRHKRIDNLWAFTSVIIFFSLFIPGSGHPNPKSPMMRKWKTTAVISQVYAGILNYKEDYGSLPTTSNNRDLIKILTGDNPKKIEYINFNAWATNSAGEAIDGWSTPIRINLTDPKNPTVRSAGRDRTWDTPDDIKEENPPKP